MTPAKTAPLVYTRDEAAQAARTSRDGIDKAIRTGQLKAKKNGRKVVIPAAALAAWLDALPDA